MTYVYFIRHAEPDLTIHDDETRPLTKNGEESSIKLIDDFDGINIDVFLSSPYKRAIDTIKPLAENRNSTIQLAYEFRERKISDGWIENFSEFSRNQWKDFNFKLPNGESLKEVQLRNTIALANILDENSGKTIVIGTHGTSLSTIINKYDETFTYSEFEKIKNKMPWIVKMTFDKFKLISIERTIN
ncbi:MAG: phosphoglycerate mutase family protein [Clostridiales bacterium]|jgi:2,3-bisphosphoglycerate-dependent phosphoglycerate mutase|nr:phosphoglycerate mutase family protein [Clostridiales bacterium]